MAIDYIWELGIDWNAIKTEDSTGSTGLTSYLRQGLVKQLPTPALASPDVKIGETIIFRIFDVTSDVIPSAPQVNGIESFHIAPKAAVINQNCGDPLSSLEPTITISPDLITAQSTVFPDVFRSWTSQEVHVTDHLGRFLLTFKTEALGADGSSRVFVHDPEMVVGPNM